MKRKNIITISDDGEVYIPTNVNMQEYEIAELFGVRYSQVRKAIAIVFKSGALNEDSNMLYSVLDNLKGYTKGSHHTSNIYKYEKWDYLLAIETNKLQHEEPF